MQGAGYIFRDQHQVSSDNGPGAHNSLRVASARLLSTMVGKCTRPLFALVLLRVAHGLLDIRDDLGFGVTVWPGELDVVNGFLAQGGHVHGRRGRA